MPCIEDRTNRTRDRKHHRDQGQRAQRPKQPVDTTNGFFHRLASRSTGPGTLTLYHKVTSAVNGHSPKEEKSQGGFNHTPCRRRRVSGLLSNTRCNTVSDG